MIDAEKIRNEFPMLVAGDKDAKPLAFLDSTATTQKPDCVIDAMNDFYREHYSSVKRGVYRLSARTTEAFEATRKNVAKFINAKTEDEIVFTRGTTESINLVAWSYGRKFFEAGDEILISGLEHHANIVSWQIVAEMKGAKIKVIPVLDSGDLDLSKLPELLNARTKMVAVTHVSNSVGTVNPIAEIIATVRKLAPQAKILIDAAQSSSHIKIDVQKLLTPPRVRATSRLTCKSSTAISSPSADTRCTVRQEWAYSTASTKFSTACPPGMAVAK